MKARKAFEPELQARSTVWTTFVNPVVGSFRRAGFEVEPWPVNDHDPTVSDVPPAGPFDALSWCLDWNQRGALKSCEKLGSFCKKRLSLTHAVGYNSTSDCGSPWGGYLIKARLAASNALIANLRRESALRSYRSTVESLFAVSTRAIANLWSAFGFSSILFSQMFTRPDIGPLVWRP
jgi:hypothetical protein